MKQRYAILFLALFLCCYNAHGQKISSKLFGRPGTVLEPQSKQNKTQQIQTVALPRTVTQQPEVAEMFNRIAEFKEYVSTPIADKTLEAITTFTYNDDNWITERITKNVAIVPGADPANPQDSKYASIYTPQPGNCILQTNIYYQRNAFQESAPWIEKERNTVKYDSKKRQLESINSISKVVVSYDDANNKEEAIFYTKQTSQPESSFKLSTKIELQRFDVNAGITIRQTRYQYENNAWKKTEMREEELTPDGHQLIAQYQLIDNIWTGVSKTGKEVDDEGRTTYAASFYWNPIENLWEFGSESAFAYDDKGRLTMELEWHEKRIYSDYFQSMPGEFMPQKQEVYIREDYGKEWMLSEEYTITANEYGNPTGIGVRSLRNGNMVSTTRSEYNQLNVNQYALTLFELSEDDNSSWQETTKNEVTFNGAHQITQVVTYYNSSTSGTPSIWKEEERITYQYVSNTEVVETYKYIDGERITYERIKYTLYPTGEVLSKTQYNSSTGEEGSWTVGETRFYKKNGTLDSYLLTRQQFQMQLETIQNIDWKIPEEVTHVKLSKYSLDLNGDGLFDNELGTYVTFVKGADEMLVFAYDNKLNAGKQITHFIRFEYPDLTGRYILDETTTTYTTSFEPLLEVRKRGNALDAIITRHREYRYDQVPTSINKASAEKLEEMMQVYGTDKLSVVTTTAMRIGIFTTDGKQLKVLQMKEGVNEVILPKGLYIVKALDDNKQKSSKVIIR